MVDLDTIRALPPSRRFLAWEPVPNGLERAFALYDHLLEDARWVACEAEGEAAWRVHLRWAERTRPTALEVWFRVYVDATGAATAACLVGLGEPAPPVAAVARWREPEPIVEQPFVLPVGGDRFTLASMTLSRLPGLSALASTDVKRLRTAVTRAFRVQAPVQALEFLLDASGATGEEVAAHLGAPTTALEQWREAGALPISAAVSLVHLLGDRILGVPRFRPEPIAAPPAPPRAAASEDDAGPILGVTVTWSAGPDRWPSLVVELDLPFEGVEVEPHLPSVSAWEERCRAHARSGGAADEAPLGSGALSAPQRAALVAIGRDWPALARALAARAELGRARLEWLTIRVLERARDGLAYVVLTGSADGAGGRFDEHGVGAVLHGTSIVWVGEGEADTASLPTEPDPPSGPAALPAPGRPRGRTPRRPRGPR